MGVEAALTLQRAHLFDLRSPAEYALDHLPGAKNLPLFGDVERALIGTLYAKESPEAAFALGREQTLKRIGPLVRELAAEVGRPVPDQDLALWVERLTSGGIQSVNGALSRVPCSHPPEGAILVHCWRGGLRSCSLAVLLNAIGWDDVFVLEGGYKSYRTHVLAELEAWKSPEAFILRGSTGVGKTLILRAIERQRPGWTLDLEGAAGHRSSILGMVGLQPCNQKTFDSRIATRLRAGFPGPVVIEGESRKVGDSIVPESIWKPLKSGVHLRLEAPMSYRVQVLIEDYLSSETNREPLRKQLPFIEARLGSNKWDGVLVDLLDQSREEELVAILLEQYYDPLYAHSDTGRVYAQSFDATDVERVALDIIAWIEARAD